MEKGSRTREAEESMSKILIVTNHSYMLYRFRKEFIERLLKHYKVVISTPFKGHQEDLIKMGCQCICTDIDRRGMNPIKDLKLMKEYWKIVSEEKPNVVITYSIKPNIYMGTVCKWRHIPYYVNVQGLGTAFESKKMAMIASAMYRFAVRKAKTVFFENIGDAQVFLDKKIVKENKVEVLSGAGINLSKYTYTDFPKEQSRHFLYLGRIMKEKGIDEWFYAAERLKAEYGNQVSFDMVGFFEDEYKEKVESLQAQGVIEFHGFKENPIPYYEKASCIVLPSYHEGMSNVLLEAAAIGRPVITSDIPGCKEAVLEGESGFVCPPQDKDRLYETMKRVMDMSDQELTEMGKKGRTHMQNRFEKSAIVEKTVETMRKKYA